MAVVHAEVGFDGLELGVSTTRGREQYHIHPFLINNQCYVSIKTVKWVWYFVVCKDAQNMVHYISTIQKKTAV